jgi:hypothetical protein
MFWELGFLALFIILFLGLFYMLNWGHDKSVHVDKDHWKFPNSGGGGV